MNEEQALAELAGGRGVLLDQLPEDQGIYGLRDHEGRLRYVGMTTMTLRRRIAQYHVAGDGNSHKYSCAYNAGLLWHDRKNAASCPLDGAVSKRARRQFARSFCRATGIPMPGMAKDQLASLERRIIDLHGPGLDWNDSKIIPTINVDSIVMTMTASWSQKDKDAMERQQKRWNRKDEI